MEVRSGGLSGVADLTYQLSTLELLALSHIDGMQVGIARFVSEAMVYDNLVSITEKLVPYPFHYTVSGGVNRIAYLSGREVNSVVESYFVLVNRVVAASEVA